MEAGLEQGAMCEPVAICETPAQTDLTVEAVRLTLAAKADGHFLEARPWPGRRTQLILEQLQASGKLTSAAGGGSTASQDSRHETTSKSCVEAMSDAKRPLAGIFLDLRPSSCAVDLQKDWAAISSWLRQASAAELAWVIDAYGVLHDPLLAERIAQAMLEYQKAKGPYMSPAEFYPVLEQLKTDYADERPNLEAAWIARALQVFVSQEVRNFRQELNTAMAALAETGRCSLITVQQWEVKVLRDFLYANEEPSDHVRATLDAKRLSSLYPLVASEQAYAVRRAAKPIKGACGDILPEKSPHATLHILEKVQRRSVCAAGVSTLPSQPWKLPDVPMKEPRAPIFAGGQARPEDCAQDLPAQLPSALSVEEQAEVDDLTLLVTTRKQQLKDQSQSLAQIKKDAQLAEMVHRINQLRAKVDPQRHRRLQAQAQGRQHVSVLLEEAVQQLLATGEDGLYVDCTFGRGGHSEAILAKLSKHGRVKAFDVDPAAVEVGNKLAQSDSRFDIIHRPFGDLASAIQEPVAGVLLDLGVSSPQLDDPNYGFSHKCKKDGPLDLRMNRRVGLPASEWLKTLTIPELTWVIDSCGHSLEPLVSQRIAEAMFRRQAAVGPFSNTHELATFLSEMAPDFMDEHPTLSLPQIVFCAVRVFLNREMSQFDEALEAAFQRLEMYGRCCIITFIKWEVVVLRRFLRDHEEPKAELLKGVPMSRLQDLYPLLQSTTGRRRGLLC
eukprot:TRINITY_DN9498_c0_g1_i10.p1 TRINITY_DN9498_c0_g1~~TRINITY_DN9498_c0_g1_i10.p1  ORF type:complete len:726 (-),score=122.71 TRINITY_DN9498_c0_g1_i10:24-2201(-)